ncbi:hypothetical protein J1N35_029933 [Gossypium stocksii]|uniref:RNase H type-1 domain-containing protein n=1 Tax=Gossypium stocksii TaxID=47602 RepID=A0A9D3UYV7_9ROSI|nr:hypothetical protein J1N35_029933 [Gossypium stocksii]
MRQPFPRRLIPYIILSCPELPLTFAYPTPEFPTPNFEYHTAFDGVVFGIFGWAVCLPPVRLKTAVAVRLVTIAVRLDTVAVRLETAVDSPTASNSALIRQISNILAQENHWILRYIPREYNQVADCLTKELGCGLFN